MTVLVVFLHKFEFLREGSFGVQTRRLVGRSAFVLPAFGLITNFAERRVLFTVPHVVFELCFFVPARLLFMTNWTFVEFLVLRPMVVREFLVFVCHVFSKRVHTFKPWVSTAVPVTHERFWLGTALTRMLCRLRNPLAVRTTNKTMKSHCCPNN